MMTYDVVRQTLSSKKANHTFGREPSMVTKSLCPDYFHTEMMMHNLTETVKRNLNFESGRSNGVAFLWNTGLMIVLYESYSNQLIFIFFFFF